VLITPDSAVSAVVVSPIPDGPDRCARPTPGAAGAGVTTGNSRARLLPLGLGANMPVAVPRGKADGRASGPIRTADPAEPLPLWPGGTGPRCDGEGDGDWDLPGEGDGLGHGALFGDDEAGPGEGDGLGHADLLGEGDGLGEPDLLGDGEGDGDLDGLGEGELLGDGAGEDVLGDGLGAGDDVLAEGDGAALVLLGEGDGDVLADAPVLGRTASRIPAAIAPPPTMARGPAHGRAGTSFLCGLRALLRVRASEVITAAWTHAPPQRFQTGPGKHCREHRAPRRGPSVVLAGAPGAHRTLSRSSQMAAGFAGSTEACRVRPG